MEYNRIVAVTGMPGLYEVLSSKADGAIVRSLEDKSTKFVSSRVHNLSHLESIEVYTVRDNVTLADIFSAIKNSGAPLPDTKDNKVVKSYFETVYPDLDFERVYPSDMKKMVKWYDVLTQNEVDFTAKSEPEEGSEEGTEEGDIEAPVAEEVAAAPAEDAAPKAKAKKAAPKKEAGDAGDADTAEAPKKASRKKKGEE